MFSVPSLVFYFSMFFQVMVVLKDLFTFTANIICAIFFCFFVTSLLLLFRLLLLNDFYSVGAKQMYYFSEFTCSLNQEEKNICPTDSRLRPDIRLMEEQNFDEANTVKLALEENQRLRRRQRESDVQLAGQEGHVCETYKPTWFEYTEDELSPDVGIYVYKGGYWEAKVKQDWSHCPDIYTTSSSTAAL